MKLFGGALLLLILSSVLNGQNLKPELRKPGNLADSLFKRYKQLNSKNLEFYGKMPIFKPDSSIKYRMPCFVPDSTIKYNMPIYTPDGIKNKNVDSVKQLLNDLKKK